MYGLVYQIASAGEQTAKGKARASSRETRAHLLREAKLIIITIVTTIPSVVSVMIGHETNLH